MRYQVLAHDYKGNETKLWEARTAHNADTYFNIEVAKLARSHGYAVYNYTDVSLLDTVKNEVLNHAEFDVTYLEEDVAYALYDMTLDEENEPVVIAGRTYRTSEALRCTDPVGYFGGYALWLDNEGVVVV